jgi:hypothetical protein
MITEHNYFSSNLSEINQEIYSFNQNVDLIKKIPINDFSKESITQKFNSIFRVFPYVIETASDSIGISIYTKELFDLFYEISEFDGKIGKERIDKSKQRFKSSQLEDDDKYLINDFLEDYFHIITYGYGDILENTKKYHFFYGIEAEEVVLMNLLKIYRNVLLDNSKQLSIFWGVTLTKKISDSVTKMLIDVIEQRLIVLNPKIGLENIPNKMTFVDNKLKTIEWLGSQQELCELFIELINKKWIPEIEHKERKNIANAITSLFDLESTKRNEKSNYKESFYQRFKGDLIGEERQFLFLDSVKYKRKFNEIGKNNR